MKKIYRKNTITWARVLSTEDANLLGGVIETREGPKDFKPGDYLAKDELGQWPIKQEKMKSDYVLSVYSDERFPGYYGYKCIRKRVAEQQDKDFEIDGLKGKAGDYEVSDGVSSWPVAKEIFESSYEEI